MRKAASVVLVALLATPPVPVGAAPSLGTVQGTVTLAGRPLTGVEVALIDLQSGAIFRATSGKDGAFEKRLAPGQYAVATENQAGLVVSKAPAYVPVVAGQVASARIDLLALPAAVLASATAPAVGAQEPPPLPAAPAPDVQTTLPTEPPPAAPTTGAGINFDAVTCFVAGEFPLLDAGIEPLPNIARARVYFRAAQGSSFYYIEMTQETGRFFGKLPRPRVEASPITYYLQATTTEFEESQTPEIEAIVVEKKEDCGDRKVAAYGPPGEVDGVLLGHRRGHRSCGLRGGRRGHRGGNDRPHRRWRRGGRDWRRRDHQPESDAVTDADPDTRSPRPPRRRRLNQARPQLQPQRRLRNRRRLRASRRWWCPSAPERVAAVA